MYQNNKKQLPGVNEKPFSFFSIILFSTNLKIKYQFIPITVTANIT